MYLFADCDGVRVHGVPIGGIPEAMPHQVAVVRLTIDGEVHRFVVRNGEGEWFFPWDGTKRHRWEMRVNGVVTDEGIDVPCPAKSATTGVVYKLPATGRSTNVALVAGVLVLAGAGALALARRRP